MWENAARKKLMKNNIIGKRRISETSVLKPWGNRSL